MKKFGDIYKNKLNEFNSIKSDKIEKDFATIYSCLINEWDETGAGISADDMPAFNETLYKLWNPEVGMTYEGERFINDRHMFLTESSTIDHKKNYLKVTVGNNIKRVMDSSDLKYKIYESIDDVLKQLKVKTLNEAMAYADVEEVIVSQVNKHVKQYFETILDELQESYSSK